jgi:thiamine biosynthesis lipoprotein
MGTVVSFDLRDPVPVSAYDAAVDILRQADQRFSTYREDSEICRLRRGELRLDRCHPDVEEVLGLCLVATEQTEGYFTAFPHGELDPTGLVKGWAIKRVSDLLVDAGSGWHAVNGGGDIALTARTSAANEWRVGISDPTDRSRVVAVASCRNGAIATSGTAERGRHIINPRTAQAATYFASVTILAATVLDADVLATAAFARGESAVDWIEQLPNVEALFVLGGGSVTWTSGFRFAE